MRENEDSQMENKLKKGIFIPSIFTAVNIGCGFLSILSAVNGRYSHAAWLIVLGWFMDSLDGRLARFLKTTSTFGIEFDSIADMTTFGVAPAVLLWIYYFRDLRNGWALCLIYVLAVAVRLAKYNVATMEESSPYFEGLPSPAGAGVISIFVLIMEIYRADTPKRSFKFLVETAPFISHILPFIILITAFLMLTKIRYPKGAGFKLTGLLPMRVFMIVVLWLVLLIIYPESIISLMVIAYVFSGLFELVKRSWKMRRIGE